MPIVATIIAAAVEFSLVAGLTVIVIVAIESMLAAIVSVEQIAAVTAFASALVEVGMVATFVEQSSCTLGRYGCKEEVGTLGFDPLAPLIRSCFEVDDLQRVVLGRSLDLGSSEECLGRLDHGLGSCLEQVAIVVEVVEAFASFALEMVPLVAFA